MIYWFTGQPGAGKTTLAIEMWNLGLVDHRVDGDDLRKLNNPGYSKEGRLQNVDRAQAIAHYLSIRGNDVAVALIAPYRKQRESFKALTEVQEIYLHCSKKRGKEKFFCHDYEPPEENFLMLNTGELSVDECIKKIRNVCGQISAVARRA